MCELHPGCVGFEIGNEVGGRRCRGGPERRQCAKGAYGNNAGAGEYGDMLEEGILDQALRHASGTAGHGVGCGSAAQDGVMIAEAPKDDEHAHGGGALGGMGDMDM